MHTFFATIRTILTIFIGVAALFVLGSLMPIEGNYSFRIVESGSMEPAIKTGSVIAVIPRDTYEVGDVVLFEGTSVNPQPVTHRIVGVEEGRFVTKGDANEDVDYRHIGENEIIGKVFLDVPYAGYIAQYFATPNGKAVLAVLVIAVFALAFVPWRRIVVRSKEEEI